MVELETLIERSRAGQLEAYGEVVRRFQDMAYGYAYSILADFHLAQDAAQEAFIQAYHDLRTLREPTAFPGWFRRIVFKHCDRIRRGRSPTQPLGAAGPELLSDEPDPPEAAETEELRDHVLEAVRSLPEHQRTVTTLFYINGYSVNDIADFLETPAGTVKRRLHDSRKQLKERMIPMVASELKESRPGPDFHEKVQEAIALQEQERFGEAVSAHRSAVEAAGAEEAGAQDLYNSYCELHDAYAVAGKLEDYAEGILRLSTEPPGGGSGWSGEMSYAANMFVDAGRPDRALALVPQMRKLAEEMEDSPKQRWYLIEAVCVELEAAVAQGDDQEAQQHRQRILDALSDYEREVQDRYPSESNAQEAGEAEAKGWFIWLGHAYHNVAIRGFLRYLGEQATALRLLRRAAELRDCDATEFVIARLTLAVDNDRKESLRRLRRAFEICSSDRQKAFLRNEFSRQPEFQPVRDASDFLAVLRQ